MAAFYFSTGPATGGGDVVMNLTIVGEIKTLRVTASPAAMNAPVPVSGFQECIPSQTVQCGPVPLQFLPLTANGLTCGTGGVQVEPVQPTMSPSPLDPGGPGSWCPVLNAGGTFTYTQPGSTSQPGGGPAGGPAGAPPGGVTTPREVCDAAQNSSLLELGKARFDYACVWLRSDQANSVAYLAAAGTAAAVAGVLAAIAAAAPYPVNVVFWVLAGVATAVALALLALGLWYAGKAGENQQRLMDAQEIWRNAIASVKRACCPEWIVINTDDLECP